MKKSLKKANYEIWQKELKEFLRLYVRKILLKKEQRELAAKAISLEYSSLNAMLKEKGRGSWENWFKLTAYCCNLKGINLREIIKDFFIPNDPFQEVKLPPNSIVLFKKLDEFPVITEEAKEQISGTLYNIFSEIQKTVDKKLSSKK